ncbi:MAG: hypothetical protein HQL99_03665 [Magnetococcales bacterium]|nr:hypothetical protein [Magnetococcales bacterium]
MTINEAKAIMDAAWNAWVAADDDDDGAEGAYYAAKEQLVQAFLAEYDRQMAACEH